MRQIRLLWITNNWLFDYGGRKIVSKKIINFLARKGFLITVLDFEIRTKKIDNINNNLDRNIKFHPIFLPDNKKVIIENMNFAKNQKFDLIICSGWAAVDLLTITARRLFGLYPNSKIILFEHTNPLYGIRLSSYWRIYQLLGKLFYRKFDQIITPGHSLKDMYVQRFGVSPHKIQVIPHPIISEKIFTLRDEKVEEKIFNQKKTKIIITSARLYLFQKDYKTLLYSFKDICKKVDAVLAILGTGPDKEKIYEMAKKIGVDDRVIFLGYQKNPFKYIARSNIFILSSFYEGSPLVLAEAMLCNIPVVSSDCEFGPKEFLDNGKCGILVPVGDSKKMAKAIESILGQNSLRERLIKRARQRVRLYDENTSLKIWYNFLLEIDTHDKNR